MTAPHDGARGDVRKRHDAPTCLACGNSVPVDASALAAAKAEALADLIERCARAEHALHGLAADRAATVEGHRLDGKREGVALVLGYIEEATR